MPKIVINEWDKTKAGSSSYTNFTVVVPGIVKERTLINGKYYYGGMVVSEDKEAASVFDENGIYECSDRSEFVNVIGKCPATDSIIIAAVAPVLDPSCVEMEDDPEDTEGTPRLNEHDEPVLDENEEPIIDYRQIPVEPHQPREVTEEEFAEFLANTDDMPFYYVSGPNTRGDYGWRRDVNYLYEPVSKESSYSDFEEGTLFAIMKIGDEGVDEEKGEQYGNQIAYELLGLGYTILYKKLSLQEELSSANFWNCLKDKAMYDFRYVITGLLTGNAGANEAIIELAHYKNKTENTGRGDCVALVDIDSVTYAGKSQEAALADVIAAVNSTTASQYAAIFAPYVTYSLNDKVVADFGKNKTFPASFHYLACAAKASDNFNEWYAIAGYTRGVSDYTIDSVGCKFGESAIDILEPRNYKGDGYPSRAVNLIVKIKNSYFLWGNRTAYKLGDAMSITEGDLRASHFLNIRQLCSTIKKQVYVACRRFTFDPNSDLLWLNFCNAIRPTLERMKADQGITDYKFVKVKSSKKALLTAKIRIVPIEAVEDFDINIYLEDSISGVTTGIEEDEEAE
jgi:hypothetical protein